jgi:uncharacterized protein (TIGR03437 family)
VFTLEVFLSKIRILVYAVLCSMFCMTALVAQTPAAVSVISGNGQLICELCIQTPFAVFDPLVIQVTDANGNPVVNTQVIWTVTAGNAFFNTGGFGSNSITSTTDSNGKTSATIGQPAAQQSGPQFGAASTITATAGGISATFSETQAAPALNQQQAVIDVVVSYQNWPLSETISGVAGSAGQSYTMLVETNTGTGIPNISLMLLNSDNTIGPSTKVPSAYCRETSGAGLYTALSSASGVATCSVVFGPVPGAGTYKVVTGGAVSTSGNAPDSNFTSGPLSLDVSQPTVGGVTVVSGTGQTGVGGSQLTALVAEVVDTNSKPLVGQGVTWAASPANAIQLNNVTSISDSNGLVKVQNPVLSASAAGTITVTATSNTNSQAVATFTITASIPVTVSSLATQGGSTPQTAVAGTAFANPLGVTVMGSNGLPVSGASVSFTASGPVTLSATSATTNSSGVAQVTATAGTPGPATVTASIAGLSAVFNLTVTPVGPNLSLTSFVNGADGQVGSISPCGIAAITGAALAPSGAGIPPVVGPLPLELSNDTVSFGPSATALQSPIFSVSSTPGQLPQIVFLVPCEVTPGTVPVTVNVNGGTQTLNVTVLPASPGVFQTTMSDGVVRAVIERPDGSFVNIGNPARRGETVTAFVTGLGAASPQVATNSLPIPVTPSTVNGLVVVGINNEGVPVTAAQLSPDMIGVYTIQFEVPSDAPQNNNVVFSVGVVPVGGTTARYSAASSIPIQ